MCGTRGCLRGRRGEGGEGEVGRRGGPVKARYDAERTQSC